MGEYNLLVTPASTEQQFGTFCGDLPKGSLQITGTFDHAAAAACEYQWFDTRTSRANLRRRRIPHK